MQEVVVGEYNDYVYRSSFVHNLRVYLPYQNNMYLLHHIYIWFMVYRTSGMHRVCGRDIIGHTT